MENLQAYADRNEEKKKVDPLEDFNSLQQRKTKT